MAVEVQLHAWRTPRIQPKNHYVARLRNDKILEAHRLNDVDLRSGNSDGDFALKQLEDLKPRFAAGTESAWET
jgi:hypothetical protein